MKRTIMGITILTLATAVVGFADMFSSTAGQPDKKEATKKRDRPSKSEPPKSAVALFMRAKLANAQSVLEGLATEDFELVRTGAERMIIMAKAAEWSSYPGELYARDTATFVDSAQELIKHAKDKNLDGATLSYVQLTMNCVACHKHFRGVKVAKNSSDGLQIRIAGRK